MNVAHKEKERWGPFRFGTRMLLLFVAICAVVFASVKQYIDLRNARDNYNRVLIAWDSDFVTMEDVVNVSEALRRTEARTFWISADAARRTHVSNLQELLKTAENRSWQVHIEGRDTYERQCDWVRHEIKKWNGQPLEPDADRQ